MSERGITMTAASVRAIEKGLKTATRRILDPQPKIFNVKDRSIIEVCSRDGKVQFTGGLPIIQQDQQLLQETVSPYGPKGAAFYVKQRWRVFRALNADEFEVKKKFQLLIDYGGLMSTGSWVECDRASFMKYAHDGDWKSPMFMPRWASRLSLEVEEVRLEQLGAMTAEDYKEEGIHPTYAEQVVAFGDAILSERAGSTWDSHTPKENFAWYFNTINQERGHPYSDDTWVWKVRFNIKNGRNRGEHHTGGDPIGS